MIPLAHGVGSRADLPLPVGYVVVGGGLALIASFAALGLLWRTPRLRAGTAGRPVSGALQRVLDGTALRAALRLLALGLSAFVLVVAWFGPASVAVNLAPWVLYVTFWVGLVPLSLLLGPVWGVVNPLRTVHAGLAKVLPQPRLPAVPARLGYYPAALSLLAFACLELALPHRGDPRRVAAFLTGYAVVHLVAACLCGAGWFTRGDGFEVYSRLLGRLAVLGRRDDGRLVWRNPLNGLAALPADRGLTAVAIVLIGSTAFDGLTRTTAWQASRYGAEGQLAGPLVALLLSTVAVAVLYAVAARAAGHVAGTPGALEKYAHSLLPIAAGYAIAHYFSLLVLDGQTTWILASDPFDDGQNLFGTAGNAVNYTLVSTRLISVVQVSAIVVGHLLGLALAHERALVLDLEGTRPHRPWQAQLPMLVVMVVLTCGALALLLGS